MPLDPFAQRFLELARASAQGRADEPSVADMRRTTDGLATFAGPERHSRVETSDATLHEGSAAVPIRIYVPASAPAKARAIISNATKVRSFGAIAISAVKIV